MSMIQTQNKFTKMAREYPSLKGLIDLSSQAVGDTVIVDWISGAASDTAALVAAGDVGEFTADTNFPGVAATGSGVIPDIPSSGVSVIVVLNNEQKILPSAQGWMHGTGNNGMMIHGTFAAGIIYTDDANASNDAAPLVFSGTDTSTKYTIFAGLLDCDNSTITGYAKTDDGDFVADTAALVNATGIVGADMSGATVTCADVINAASDCFSMARFDFAERPSEAEMNLALTEMMTNWIVGNIVPYSGWKGRS